jgi:hypothetical protein
MPISENQLDTWSHQGSIQQSASTYETIRNALRDPNAPFASRSFEVFLQGSYANSTNIWADSDIDVVICLDSTYYEDITSLSDGDKQRHDAAWTAATYGYDEFRADVVAWLKANFGNGVDASGKAVFVPSSGNRRDADVLVSAEFRNYHSYIRGGSDEFWRGICFWPPGQGRIINYPKQHIANCTSKHQVSNQRFKPTVRVLKNLRNAMVDEGYLQRGLAPSYFLEGMIWNVPANLYGPSYQGTLINAVRWLVDSDKTQLVCANNIHWLLRDGHSVCWREESFDRFIAGFSRYWNR